MKRPMNIGLIGAGRLGMMYAEYLPCRIPRANLIAVAASHSLKANRVVHVKDY
jgi:predicted homoserine dehydrogenase-like protein